MESGTNFFGFVKKQKFRLSSNLT